MNHCFKCPGEVLYSCLTQIKFHRILLEMTEYMLIWRTFQFSSFTQLCPTPCDPMDYSTPGLPVYHQLLEFTQTHVHWVSDAIQPTQPPSSPFPPTLASTYKWYHTVLSFSVNLFHFSIMPSQSIHEAANCRISFLFMVVHYSIMYV